MSVTVFDSPPAPGWSSGFANSLDTRLRPTNSWPSTASEKRWVASPESVKVSSAPNWLRSTGAPVKSVGKWKVASV
ncbi:MAG: hypothetical protein ACREMG_15175 [Gemmatimonadales bacterium]